MEDKKTKAYFHLPGLFEFYELYKEFLPLFYSHREYFYDWCEIGSLYGAPCDCIFSGGRVSESNTSGKDALELANRYGISARLTFSNSLLEVKHLTDERCNRLCKLFNENGSNGIIVHSELLLEYLREHYPNLYFVSSTTKVITSFEKFVEELNREEFQYVVADFRLNKSFDKLNKLSQLHKDKVELLCNECCYIGCKDREECYKSVSAVNLEIEAEEFKCTAAEIKDGYRFSKAMKNPSFISIEDIQNIYLPNGFTNFKIEGRSLGSALILEFLLYYLTKPEYQLIVREEIYLSNELDLF